MAVVGIFGAKGGSGASLVATNLSLSLARWSECLLVDLHPTLGYDDLLLNLQPERSWLDLLPVARELTDRHLELAVAAHPSKLQVLAAGDRHHSPVDLGQLDALLKALADRYAWLVLDLPVGCELLGEPAKAISDVLLLVATPDPPALRAARRIVEHMPKEARSRTGLVLNQIGSQHPAHPASVASSLGLTLLAGVPPDPSAVAMQVNFGRACVDDGGSLLGRAIHGLAIRLETARKKGQLGILERSERPEAAQPLPEESS
jgi:Flp pilus assembly CpaE family ATPase